MGTSVNWEGILRWTSIPSRGSNASKSLDATETGISSGLMSQLMARAKAQQTLPYYKTQTPSTIKGRSIKRRSIKRRPPEL